MTRRNRDQFFAEAVHCYRLEQKWWPDGDFERKHIKPVQDACFEVDAWECVIESWLGNKTRVTVVQVALEALSVQTPRIGTADQRRIGAILQRLGWKPIRDHKGRAYVLDMTHDAP